MNFTHWIYNGALIEKPDLHALHRHLVGSQLKQRPFVLCMWRTLQGTLLVFKSGKVTIHGKDVHFFTETLRVINYRLVDIHLVTRSATYRLKAAVDYQKIVREFNGSYEAELNNTAIIKRDGEALLIHHNGVVCITGLVNEDRVATALGVLLELEL